MSQVPEYKRGEIASVKKHTPNRKCIRQKLSEDGTRVWYYHVTKGWRTRLTAEASLQKIFAVIGRAQHHHHTVNR